MLKSEKNPLHAIFGAKSVAFVGASNNPTTMGTTQMLLTLNGGFKGPVIPVHPREKIVLGQKAYPHLSDIPQDVDLAVLIVPTRAALDVVKDAIKKGIKHLVITTAGFRETGKQGQALEQELRRITSEAGIRFVGPNCIGVLNTNTGLNTTFAPYTHAPGHLGLASQSGTYITQTLDLLKRWGIGLSKGISIGNATDIDLADALDYFAQDPETKAVGLYIEGIDDGRRFLQAAKRCTAIKPVVALYAGGSEAGARAGASHTGAMAGPDRLYDGMFKQAGIIRASTLADLYQWGWALATQPIPKGRNIAILTHSGGPATSMADATSRAGLNLPRFEGKLLESIRKLIPSTGSASNPIDLTFSMDPKLLAETLPELLLSSDEVDGLLLHGIQGSSFFEDLKNVAGDLLHLELDQVKSLTEHVVQPLLSMSRRFDKPILTSSFFDRRDNLVRLLQDNSVPVYDMPERSVAAMAALVQYSRIKQHHVT